MCIVIVDTNCRYLYHHIVPHDMSANLFSSNSLSVRVLYISSKQASLARPRISRLVVPWTRGPVDPWTRGLVDPELVDRELEDPELVDPELVVPELVVPETNGIE